MISPPDSEGIPFSHMPVMPEECIKGLDIKPGGIYVDCTLGGGGHSSLILKELERLSGKAELKPLLIGIDRDEAALNAAEKVFKKYQTEGIRTKIILRNTNFENINTVCEEFDIKKVDGILMDLGVSSNQLDDKERGFSYSNDAPLDMRMDRKSKITAQTIVNNWSKKELETVIFTYGEERWAARIAQFICEAREKGPIITTRHLAELTTNAIPAAARRKGPHPAKRTFQAIRIAVNDELGSLERALEKCIDLLNIEGRLCVITFHSLEDRIVKRAIEKALNPCTCPKSMPVCVCGKGKPFIENITRKPYVPSEEEVDKNPRARSAKLRIARKVT